jgi:N-methylhydantoinase A/oxoprolinase/acetone carboxylase beta subunit
VHGRIDVLGQEALPLREDDVRAAARELLDAYVEGICVCLLLGYLVTQAIVTGAVGVEKPALPR